MIYLAEAYKNNKLEPLGIFSDFEAARAVCILSSYQNKSLLTELELDKIYADGIGVAKHWHYENGELNR